MNERIVIGHSLGRLSQIAQHQLTTGVESGNGEPTVAGFVAIDGSALHVRCEPEKFDPKDRLARLSLQTGRWLKSIYDPYTVEPGNREERRLKGNATVLDVFRCFEELCSEALAPIPGLCFSKYGGLEGYPGTDFKKCEDEAWAWQVHQERIANALRVPLIMATPKYGHPGPHHWMYHPDEMRMRDSWVLPQGAPDLIVSGIVDVVRAVEAGRPAIPDVEVLRRLGGVMTNSGEFYERTRDGTRLPSGPQSLCKVAPMPGFVAAVTSFEEQCRAYSGGGLESFAPEFSIPASLG